MRSPFLQIDYNFMSQAYFMSQSSPPVDYTPFVLGGCLYSFTLWFIALWLLFDSLSLVATLVHTAQDVEWLAVARFEHKAAIFTAEALVARL